MTSHLGGGDLGVEVLDILDAAFQAVAGAHRNIADVGRLARGQGDDIEGMVVGSDPLDGADRPRSEPRARPIGDAQIHRHADQGEVQAAEVLLVGGLRAIGGIEEGRNAGVRQPAFVAALEDQGHDLGEPGIIDLAGLGLRVGRPQRRQLLLIEHRFLSWAARLGVRGYLSVILPPRPFHHPDCVRLVPLRGARDTRQA